MDVSLAPKLLAAAVLGGTAGSAIVRPAAAADSVLLKLEWIQTAGAKKSESLALRAMLDQQTTYREGSRVVTATPSIAEDGSVVVKLSVIHTDAEALTTQIRSQKGETTVVMSTTKRDGRATSERLLFLTVN